MERILDVHRNPRLAEDVEHSYDNKYGLADLLTNTAIIAQMNILERLGLTADLLKSIDTTKPTTLRFQASDSCTFLKEQIVKVPMPHSFDTKEETKTTGSFFGSTSKSTVSQIINNVKEYHWKWEVSWELSVYSGTDIKERKVLGSRTSSTILITQSQTTPPLPEHTTYPLNEVPLTWLIKMIDCDTLTARFRIDTENPATKTPFRNQDIEDTLTFMESLGKWARSIIQFFIHHVQRIILSEHNPAGSPAPTQTGKLNSISSKEIFCPIQPLMEGQSTKSTETGHETQDDPKSVLTLKNVDTSPESPLMSGKDMTKLLNEQIRTIDEMTLSLQKTFPSKQLVKLLSMAEATVVLLCKHCTDLILQYTYSMGYIEEMLKDQLVAAIGKQIEPKDLDQFVKFHNARLLNPPPKPFCHTIRRPEHYPDGVLSIERDANNKMEPIDTLVRQVATTAPLQVPLNAATTIELTGDMYLHGWVQHRFEDSNNSYKLIARARQFSCFILVVGTMAGPNQLEPKDAIIVQNKDEVLIPLVLNELPTAKEFKDAIKSLSPEQQRFAQAFRSMQLESSVFGVCVIQVKPQLEALLGLPDDSLTKEMQLTQDLMELFIDYQVPSDLLSYDGPVDMGSVQEKVANVKEHVKVVLDVIKVAKVKQLEESTMKADMAVERAIVDEPYDWAGANFARSLERVDCLIPGDSIPRRAMSSKMVIGGSFPRSANDIGAVSKCSAPMMGDDVSRSMQGMGPRSKEISILPKSFGGSEYSNEGGGVELSKAPKEVQTFADIQLSKNAEGTIFGDNQGVCVDFTMIPKVLDAKMEKYDTDNALRSTIISAGIFWTRRHQENLLSSLKDRTLVSDEIKSETNKAFDLLDALSRSGSLPIACSELHVIVAVTHGFENDVMGTVIQDNVNPIEKLEKSTLLVASAIHGIPAQELIHDSKVVQRLTASFPALFDSAGR